jgi:hypothetical protein
MAETHVMSAAPEMDAGQGGAGALLRTLVIGSWPSSPWSTRSRLRPSVSGASRGKENLLRGLADRTDWPGLKPGAYAGFATFARAALPVFLGTG